MTDLRIPGVLDLQRVMLDAKDVEGWTYYIDDAIDFFSHRHIWLHYNTGYGLFDVNGQEVYGDGKGTNITRSEPIHPNWEWSLNYPRSSGQSPYIRINVGNVRVTSDYNSEYPINRYAEVRLANLYVADKLTWETKPEIKEMYFSDEPMVGPNWKEHWYAALKNARVRVDYRNLNAIPNPSEVIEPKYMVMDPKTDMELSLASHLVRWPMITGPRELIQENYYFQVAHDNSEKYGDANINASWVVLSEPVPIEVYMFGTEEGEGALTVEARDGYSFPLTWDIYPLNAIGSSAQLFSRIKITGTYTFYAMDGTTKEATKELDPRDGRIFIRDSRRASYYYPETTSNLVDNATDSTPGNGIYLQSWWRDVREEEELYVVYIDWWRDFIPYPEDKTIVDLAMIDRKNTDPRLRYWVYGVNGVNPSHWKNPATGIIEELRNPSDNNRLYDWWPYGFSDTLLINPDIRVLNTSWENPKNTGNNGFRVAVIEEPITITLIDPNEAE